MEFVEYTIDELSLEIKTGKTPPTSSIEYFDGDIVWLTPSDLKGSKINDNSKRKLSYLALDEKKIFLFPSKTVLLSTIGNIGKACIVKKPVASNQQLTGILANDKIILPELLYYWIKRSEGLLESKANKAVISMLSNKLLKRVRVSFPKELEEQYKIISQLNKIQVLIDQRIESIRLIDEYLHSIFLEMFLQNSKKWEYKLLKDSGGIKSRIQGVGRVSSPENKGEPMLRMNNLSDKGEIILDSLKWIELSTKEKETFQLKDRNVLFNRTNSPELVGKIAVWDKGDGYTFAGYLVKLELNEDVLNPYYLTGYFNSDFGKNVLRNKARLSGSLANLSGSKLLEQLILIPPVDLQSEYEKIHSKVQKQKYKYQKQLEKLKIFFQASLQSAFSEGAHINEDEVFESLLQNYTIEELKKGDRLMYLLNWIDKDKMQFSSFEQYDNAWNKLRKLLEDGSIEQFIDNDEIKLRLAQ
ncbi:restriction endonuclease subunit S [Pseudoalteromonas distincta]|uniref:restriction endonuclease subunit S n=1 Tax=Pseudoalteromonas distincta TaxID=77608 RepID=UPI00321853AE